MKQLILLLALTTVFTTQAFTQQIGETKEVEVMNIHVEAPWKPLYFHVQVNQPPSYKQRYVQRTFYYTPPDGWVITSYHLAHEYSRSGFAEIIFEQGGEIQLTVEDLETIYYRLLDVSDNLENNRELKDQIRKDYERHKDILQHLKTELNRMAAIVQVESHGQTPKFRTTALQNTGVYNADISATLVYAGIGDIDYLFEQMAQKYGLMAVAELN